MGGVECVGGMCMCVGATWSFLVYGCHWDVCTYVCICMCVLCWLQVDIEELRRSNVILEEKGIVCVFFCKSTLPHTAIVVSVEKGIMCVFFCKSTLPHTAIVLSVRKV